MRLRFIVAVAALIAVTALVAVPGPAGSQSPTGARAIDPASFTDVAFALDARSTATTTSTTDLDPANRAAGAVGPDSVLTEPAEQAPARQRPRVDQPEPKAGVVIKPTWRWDPEISWYGPGFYGSGTACGQTYTRSILGVAHRTLPCGTRVTFRNPSNGRTITLPVIDRGPYVSGRQFDLSKAACTYLGHCYTGPIQYRYP